MAGEKIRQCDESMPERIVKLCVIPKSSKNSVAARRTVKLCVISNSCRTSTTAISILVMRYTLNVPFQVGT